VNGSWAATAGHIGVKWKSQAKNNKEVIGRGKRTRKAALAMDDVEQGLAVAGNQPRQEP
jgi:hypothetical protein